MPADLFSSIVYPNIVEIIVYTYSFRKIYITKQSMNFIDILILYISMSKPLIPLFVRLIFHVPWSKHDPDILIVTCLLSYNESISFFVDLCEEDKSMQKHLCWINRRLIKAS